MTDPGRPAVLFVGFAVLAWAAFGSAGFAPTVSLQHDAEKADASFGADGDLTVEVRSARLSPGRVAANGTENVTVELDVNATDAVDDSRFVLTLAESDRTVTLPPERVTCGGDDCALTVPEQTVAALADGAGEYKLVVRGWWTYDRQFVGRVPVTVASGAGGQSNAGAAETTTATNTSVATTATTQSTNTTTGAATNTTTQPTNSTTARTATSTASTATQTTPTTSATSGTSTTSTTATTSTSTTATTATTSSTLAGTATSTSPTTDDTSTTDSATTQGTTDTMTQESTNTTTTQETTNTATVSTTDDASGSETTTTFETVRSVTVEL